MLIKMLIVFNHSNLPINLLYLCTSLIQSYRKINWLELACMGVDTVQLLSIQFSIYSTYSLYKDTESRKVHKIRDIVFIKTSYMFRIDKLITIPLGLFLNIWFAIKCSLVFGLRRYPSLFILSMSIALVVQIYSCLKIVNHKGQFHNLKLMVWSFVFEFLFTAVLCVK